MKTKLLIKNQSKDLIIFISGWGCDDNEFVHIKSSKNVLITWDYSDKNFDFNFDFSQYENIYLLTFSAGVFVAGIMQDSLPKLKYKVAINGNPDIFDEVHGLSKRICQIFREIDETNYLDFRKNYLCLNDNDLEIFNQHPSLRSIESCNLELDALQELAKNNTKSITYDEVFIGSGDKIFNPVEQQKYYSQFKDTKISVVEGAHNLFGFRFSSFDDFFTHAKN